MVASPVAAANPAASLSLRGEATETTANQETPAPAAAQPEAAPAASGGLSSTALLVGGLVVIAVIAGALALGHHSSHPASA
jgi:hypothetical protein